MQEIVTLSNGSTYKIINSGKDFVDGEYPQGGYAIYRQTETGDFVWIDNSPDLESVQCFLNMVSKNRPEQF